MIDSNLNVVKKRNEIKSEASNQSDSDYEIKSELNQMKEIDITIKKERSLNLSFKDKTLNEIIEIYENGKNDFNDFEFIKSSPDIIFVNKKKQSEIHIIFGNPKCVIYENVIYNNKIVKLIDKSVYSTIQIEKTMIDYDIKNLFFLNDTGNYNENKYYLINLFNESILSFKCLNKNIKCIKNDFCFGLYPNDFNFKYLDKYFNKYFIYNNEPLESIKYIQNEERKKLFNYLNEFIFMGEIHFFKICGPSNNGKSTSLLVYSRKMTNIVYFNLKVIYELYFSNINHLLELLMYELCRIKLNDNEQKNFYDFFNSIQDKTPWDIIYRIINYFLNKKIIFIFDQFKNERVDYFFFKRIEQIIKDSNIKIIICSSINDKDIREEIIKSIQKNNTNPLHLSIETQQYYFYFSNLLDKTIIKDNIQKKENEGCYEMFDYNPKYVFLLENSENINIEINKIENHIKKKIKETFDYKNYSLEAIFFFLSLKVNKNLNYTNDISVLNITPLKYFTLILEKDFFQIKYTFKFIETISNNCLFNFDMDIFFQEKKYKNDPFFDGIKGDYFEASAKKYNEEKNIFPENITHELNVNNIIGLEESENDNNYYLFSQKSNILNEKNIKNDDEYNEYINKEIKNINEELNAYNKEEIENKKDINYYYYKNLEEDIQLLKKKKNRRNKDELIKIINYKEDFMNGAILINQNKKTGKTLDQGFLYGNKNNKIFIGLQTKFYNQNTTINEENKKKLTKYYIKESINKILIKAKKFYNIKICQWHYFFIIFYNKEGNIYNEKLINLCKKEDIEYLFYDPNLKQLFDSKFMPINKLKLTDSSNLDLDPYTNPYNIFRIDGEKFMNQRRDFNEKKKLNNEANLLLKEINNNKNISEIIRSIKQRINFIESITLIGIFNLSNNIPFPSPHHLYCFLFINKDKNDLIYYYNLNEEFYSEFLYSKEKIDDICNLSSYIEQKKDRKFLVFKLNYNTKLNDNIK